MKRDTKYDFKNGDKIRLLSLEEALKNVENKRKTVKAHSSHLKLDGIERNIRYYYTQDAVKSCIGTTQIILYPQIGGERIKGCGMHKATGLPWLFGYCFEKVPDFVVELL